jgi:hypothetical protein
MGHIEALCPDTDRRARNVLLDPHHLGEGTHVLHVVQEVEAADDIIMARRSSLGQPHEILGLRL